MGVAGWGERGRQTQKKRSLPSLSLARGGGGGRRADAPGARGCAAQHGGTRTPPPLPTSQLSLSLSARQKSKKSLESVNENKRNGGEKNSFGVAFVGLKKKEAGACVGGWVGGKAKGGVGGWWWWGEGRSDDFTPPPPPPPLSSSPSLTPRPRSCPPRPCTSASASRSGRASPPSTPAHWPPGRWPPVCGRSSGWPASGGRPSRRRR